MKAIIFSIMFAMACGAFSGCSAIRYNLGYRAGMKEYEKMKRTSKAPRSYGVGYVNGISLMTSLDALEESSKKFTDAVKELEALGKRQNKRMEELKVTDDAIDKALKDAFDDLDKTQ